ncbi:hypothetical protein NDU88_012369 [Pleurodeles waltl]|uniref:Uncharacterized protein n=1 Tax=Pleurodeles waltl TaxID=8319 RepID=A0AAV7R317_PLEWA|nr:hypothetical protein NDU88_012369 [Pleurodeles waltl]
MELQDVLGRHRPLSEDTEDDQKSSHGHGRGAGEWVSAPRGGTPNRVYGIYLIPVSGKGPGGRNEQRG